MAGTAIPGRLGWQLARLLTTQTETPRVMTLRLASAVWPGHLPGQHVDVQLTAEDGYQAQRSYSIASVPEASRLDLTVEAIADGEVSPYLSEELRLPDGSRVGSVVQRPRPARKLRAVVSCQVIDPS